jgi:exopolyphosphatase/guanosine-5'-triphosphate,3'-diphosphate pyrophosphatase
MEDTLQVLADYVGQARALGVEKWAVSATSAARDAENGQEFLSRARERAGVEVRIISGDLEAQLVYSAAVSEFGHRLAGQGLVVIDIGGGSTEFIYGRAGSGKISFRRSYDVGSVRLTERYLNTDPIRDEDRARVYAELHKTFSELPAPGPSTVIGVAGTVTTLFAVQNRIEPYDASKVHGGRLTLQELSTLANRLCAIPLEERKRLPGLQPKRADVICAGALILETALQKLGVAECLVSDRGLRWGLLLEHFGPRRNASR